MYIRAFRSIHTVCTKCLHHVIIILKEGLQFILAVKEAVDPLVVVVPRLVCMHACIFTYSKIHK